MSSANINVNINANAKKAVANIGKTTKAMKGLKQASGRRGGAAMGVLEVSRAVEDFSVAGMRGALNNIPGMIMSLGAGAGLAGAASLAAVGVMQLTKAIEALMDSAQKAFEQEQSKGLVFIGKRAEFASKKLRELKTSAEESFAELSEGVNEQAKLDQARRSADEAIEQSARKVRNERELLDLRKKGASQSDIELKTIEQQGRAIQANFDRLAKGNLDSRQKLDALREREAANQEIIDKGVMERARRDRILADAKTATREEMLRSERTMSNSEANEFFEQAKGFRGLTKDVELRVKKAAEAEELARRENEIIADKIQAEERSVRIWSEQNAAKKEQLKDQAALLEMRREELELSRQLAQKEARASVVESLATSSSGLLGSLASVGLGATEAVNSLNIQKNIFNTLKSIDKSLKGKLAAYASA